MSAWAVTWDWMADAAAVADELAAVLPARFASHTIARFVEHYYSVVTSTVHELTVYTRNRRNNRFRAEIDFNGRVTCGGHPFLFARHVSELTVTSKGERGLETISWREPDVYRPTDTGPVIENRGGITTIERRITGPLSTMAIWDRETGAFKPGWGDGEIPEQLLV